MSKVISVLLTQNNLPIFYLLLTRELQEDSI
jgi:hypothetical protein